MTTPVSDTPKLTKKGKPDGRSISSRKNIQKAHSIVKEIMTKAKSMPVVVDDVSEDSDSETEYTLKKTMRSSGKSEGPAGKPKAKVDNKAVVDNTIVNLTKAVDDLRNENQQMKNMFTKTNHLHRVNSMSQNMLMRF